MNIFNGSLSTLIKYKKEYLMLNTIYYGLIISSAAYVTFIPSIQKTLIGYTETTFSSGLLSSVGDAYSSGSILTAILLTFMTNLLLGSMAQMTFPSIIIPFSGLFMGMFRAVMWGFLFSPTGDGFGLKLIPHSITILIEGQAYVVVMLAAYLQGKSLLHPKSESLSSHTQGFIRGIKHTFKLYPVIICLLLVASVYEALEVILIVPHLG